MDFDVRIHYAPFHRDSTKLFRVHRGRVKDIASSWGVPKVFWTAAEDGLVYQFDIRSLPKSDGRTETPDTSGILIRLGRGRRGKTLRGMGMAVHPHDPTKVALACGDFYTRLYDRRMLRIQQLQTTPATSRGATIPAEVFAPPHLHLDECSDTSVKRRHDSSHGTSIQFSSDGSELLANYHNDHIYLFKIGNGPDPTTTYNKGDNNAEPVTPAWHNGMDMDQPVVKPKLSRSEVESVKETAGDDMDSENYSEAIKFSLLACGGAKGMDFSEDFVTQMHHTSAKAYLARGWNADVYLAAVHCKLALEAQPNNREVELTYIKALYRDKRYSHAAWLSQRFREKYPEHEAEVDEYSDGHRSQRARSAIHPSFRFHDSLGDSDSSEDSEVERDRAPSAGEDHTESSEDNQSNEPTSEEGFWQSRLVTGQSVNCDVVRRYIGYCNVQTDIKEASFFGKNDAYIVAGSDDGRAFIWDKLSGKLVNAIEADADIVNCVQPHPFDACLATSGIENVIRLWTPTATKDTALEDDELDELVHNNQTQMGDLLSAYIGGHPNVIRLVFSPDGDREGVQECATS